MRGKKPATLWLKRFWRCRTSRSTSLGKVPHSEIPAAQEIALTPCQAGGSSQADSPRIFQPYPGSRGVQPYPGSFCHIMVESTMNTGTNILTNVRPLMRL